MGFFRMFYNYNSSDSSSDDDCANEGVNTGFSDGDTSSYVLR